MTTLTGHGAEVSALATFPGGRRSVSASVGTTLRIWKLGREVEVQTLRGHTKPIRAVAVTPDSKFAISGSDDHMLKICMWSTE